jgi:hypothetical protein
MNIIYTLLFTFHHYSPIRTVCNKKRAPGILIIIYSALNSYNVCVCIDKYEPGIAYFDSIVLQTVVTLHCYSLEWRPGVTLECFVCKLRDVRQLCISRATSSVSSEYLVALKYQSRVIVLASPRRWHQSYQDLSEVYRSVYVGNRSGKYFSIDIPVLRTHRHK